MSITFLDNGEPSAYAPDIMGHTAHTGTLANTDLRLALCETELFLIRQQQHSGGEVVQELERHMRTIRNARAALAKQ